MGTAIVIGQIDALDFHGITEVINATLNQAFREISQLAA
jgi:hypothetical protein